MAPDFSPLFWLDGVLHRFHRRSELFFVFFFCFLFYVFTLNTANATRAVSLVFPRSARDDEYIHIVTRNLCSPSENLNFSERATRKNAVADATINFFEGRVNFGTVGIVINVQHQVKISLEGRSQRTFRKFSLLLKVGLWEQMRNVEI